MRPNTTEPHIPNLDRLLWDINAILDSNLFDVDDPDPEDYDELMVYATDLHECLSRDLGQPHQELVDEFNCLYIAPLFLRDTDGVMWLELANMLGD